MMGEKVSASRICTAQDGTAIVGNDGVFAAVTDFSIGIYLGHGSPLCWCSSEASLNMAQKTA